ncbi:MAG: hypothetical protein ACKPKO_23775, partial [Candidatus Fonsibacter sp.]
MDLTGCNTSSGIGLLHADMVEPVMANAAISGMCKGMMGMFGYWQWAVIHQSCNVVMKNKVHCSDRCVRTASVR